MGKRGKGSSLRQGPLNVSNVQWGKAKDKKEPLISGTTLLMTLCGLFGLMMLGLFFLVEDAVPPQAEMPDQPEPEPEKPVREKYVFQYLFSSVIEGDKALEMIKGQTEEDGNTALIVVVMDDTADGAKTKNWKRWERIAKSIHTKQLFQRYEEPELPKVLRIDCSSEGSKELCGQLRESHPGVPALYFKDSKARNFGMNTKSDKKIMEELFDRMQPAVRYIEEIDDIVDFMDGTEEPIKIFLFGDDKEGNFEAAADNMREWAKFAKNRKPSVASHFDVENTPEIVMYRDFEPSRVVFEGERTIENITSFVLNNQLPLLGEYTQKTAVRYYRKQYMSGGSKSMVAINLDPSDEESSALMEAATEIAKEEENEFIFTYVDALVGSGYAKNLGMESYPMVSVIGKDKPSPTTKEVDPTDPRGSIMAAIEAFKAPPEEEEIDDDEYYYDEGEYEDEEGDVYGDDSAEGDDNDQEDAADADEEDAADQEAGDDQEAADAEVEESTPEEPEEAPETSEDREEL